MACPATFPCELSLAQVILYAGMSDKQRELNQQLRDRTLNVRWKQLLHLLPLLAVL
jgi:hypothetical protein